MYKIDFSLIIKDVLTLLPGYCEQQTNEAENISLYHFIYTSDFILRSRFFHNYIILLLGHQSKLKIEREVSVFQLYSVQLLQFLEIAKQIRCVIVGHCWGTWQTCNTLPTYFPTGSHSRKTPNNILPFSAHTWCGASWREVLRLLKKNQTSNVRSLGEEEVTCEHKVISLASLRFCPVCAEGSTDWFLTSFRLCRCGWSLNFVQALFYSS